MKTTLNSIDLVWIPQYSSYNYNFYMNIVTGQIILAISDDDNCTGYEYTSIENMRNGTRKGNELIGYAYDSDFRIPECFGRFRDCSSKIRAKECSYEFDSEIC